MKVVTIIRRKLSSLCLNRWPKSHDLKVEKKTKKKATEQMRRKRNQRKILLKAPKLVIWKQAIILFIFWSWVLDNYLLMVMILAILWLNSLWRKVRMMLKEKLPRNQMFLRWWQWNSMNIFFLSWKTWPKRRPKMQSLKWKYSTKVSSTVILLVSSRYQLPRFTTWKTILFWISLWV